LLLRCGVRLSGLLTCWLGFGWLGFGGLWLGLGLTDWLDACGGLRLCYGLIHHCLVIVHRVFE